MDTEHRRYLHAIFVLLSLYIGIFVAQLLASDVFSIGFVVVSLIVAGIVARVAWWVAGLAVR